MPTSTRRAEIANVLGLHLRVSDRFVRLAQRSRAEIRVSCGDRRVDGKSILDLAALAVGCGTRLELEAVGLDAEEAVFPLAALIEAGFHEADP